MNKEAKDIIEKLTVLSSETELQKMNRIGINTQTAFGINLTKLREIAKPYKNNHALALELWECGVHEAKIMATMIDNPKLVTKEQISSWSNDFYSWDICDLTCRNLFENTKYVIPLISKWTKCKRIFKKRAGFVLIARLAKVNKKISNKKFSYYLSIVEKNSSDERNLVMKSVAWALRQIGKRNNILKEEATLTAYIIGEKKDKSSRWIASNYFVELGIKRND